VTYGITKRMKDIRKVLDKLDQLARKWQQEDVPTIRTKIKDQREDTASTV
jgi:DNA-binding HxlR family transcriptional regulator